MYTVMSGLNTKTIDLSLGLVIILINFQLGYIRECGSTLYVGLAHTAPPTNTNFRLTFLLPRLQEALYGDIPYRALNLNSTITFLALVS